MFGATTTDRLSRDDRAASEVIGAILVFALLILLLVLIQVNAVPAANKQVEFEHNTRVTQDFQSLQEGLLAAGTTGNDVAVSVETGVSYPPRFFLLNPAPSTGALRATPQQAVTLRNAEASGNVGDYWTGDDARTYTTRGIAYTPDYNELPNPGTMVWEHSMLYTRYDNGYHAFEDPTSVVDGRRISLTLLDSQLSTSALSTAVEIAPISTQRRTVTLEGGDDPMTISLETDLPREYWVTAIDGDGGADPEPYATLLPESDPLADGDDDTVDIAFDQGTTYELQVSKVRLGTSVTPDTEATYLTDVSGNGTIVSEGRTHQMVVEVRDQYNNPISNVPVSAAEVDPQDLPGGDVSLVGATGGVARTDSDGQVTVEYTAPPAADVDADTPVEVRATIDDNSGLAERVTFELTVEDTDGSGDPDTNGGTQTAGQGGESDWTTTDKDEEFVLPNGVWSNISPDTAISQIILSDGLRVPIDGCNYGGNNCNVQGTLRVDFRLSDDTNAYYGTVVISSDERRVAIFDESLGTQKNKIFDESLKASVVDDIFTDTGVDILKLSNYDNPKKTNKVEPADALNRLKLQDATWATAVMNGRVTVYID